MNLLFNSICAGVIWTLLFLVRLVMTLLGVVIVPIALPFAKEYQSDRTPSWKGWKLIRLPKWAWCWDNLRDGVMGDTSGNYWFEQAPKWAKTAFLKKFNWLALRNPCNNFSRFVPLLSIDMDGELVKPLSVGQKHLFLKVIGKPYWHFMWELPFGTLKLGHKIALDHNFRDWSEDPQKAIKGFTFRVDFK